MEKYFNRHVATVSLFCGISGYAFAIIFTESILAAYFALSCTLLMMLLMPVKLFFMEKRYRSFESSFQKLIQMRVNAHCHFDTGGRNGYLYAIQELLCFACFDKKPYLIIRLPLSKIQSVYLLHNNTMRVALETGQSVDFISPDIDELFVHIKSRSIGKIYTQVL